MDDLIPFDEVYQPEKFKSLRDAGYLFDRNKEISLESAYPNASFWENKRVLVTGSSGMVGSTMIDILVSMGADVYGTIKRHAVAYHPNIQQHIDNGILKTVEVDLRDYGRVISIIKDIEPHVIFHQASESFVPTSIDQPSYVAENNCVSTVNILEATKNDKNLEGIQLACSSEQYGFVKNIDELPIKETNELNPTSTYAVTKVFTDYIGRAYYYMNKTPTIITRTFNQEGPRRGSQFFTARIASQIHNCIEGKADKIIMGNPNAVRDFSHVHDSAKAQILAIEKCNHGEVYNICSGVGITTGEYAKLALEEFELDVPIFINKNLLRNYERGEAFIDGFIGDNTKFVKATGWKPLRSVLDIIRDSVYR